MLGGCFALIDLPFRLTGRLEYPQDLAKGLPCCYIYVALKLLLILTCAAVNIHKCTRKEELLV